MLQYYIEGRIVFIIWALESRKETETVQGRTPYTPYDVHLLRQSVGRAPLLAISRFRNVYTLQYCVWQMAVDDKAVYQQNHISIINKLMYRYCFFLFLTISTVQLPNSYSVASFQMGQRVLNHSARRREVAPTLQSATFGTDSTKILFSSVDDIRSSIKGVLFDIDGTLADSWKLGFDATQVVLQKNGIAEITEEIYHDYTKYCTPDRLARHAGFVPEDGHVFFSVGQKLGREFDDLYVNLVSITLVSVGQIRTHRRLNMTQTLSFLILFSSGIYQDSRILSRYG